jgi:hypothetical protein
VDRVLYTYLGRGMGLIKVFSRLPVQRSVQGQLEIAKRGSIYHRLAIHFTNLIMWFSGVLTAADDDERLPALEYCLTYLRDWRSTEVSW